MIGRAGWIAISCPGPSPCATSAPARCVYPGLFVGTCRAFRDVQGADLLIHDAQYTAQEYPEKMGWGHSPVEYVVKLADQALVKRVALTLMIRAGTMTPSSV